MKEQQSPTTPPQPLTTRTPWVIVGISRTAWFRLVNRPRPVDLGPGVRRVWRIADLKRWLERRPHAKPGKMPDEVLVAAAEARRRKKAEANGQQQPAATETTNPLSV
jgi:hypothetical protein